MSTMTETKENCRKQTGNLKINNKLYPIYEGLNIIGRDAKSTIILKETIFSKLHAAISVVDANTHLLCDLNSSNGTQLGKLKLIPYKFYSINDHEPIIFGDIVGMYFKGTELQNNGMIKVSSQNVDHEASTQILNNLNNTVENIHELPTQVLSETNSKTESFNIHEAPTQNYSENKAVSFNIHEAPTQIFSETNSKPENNIHEAPTQIFPETITKPENNIHEAPTQIFPETNSKPENNIHEAPTQIFPETKSKPEINIHEAPTQCFKPEDDQLLITNEEKNSSNYNINDSDEDDATQDLDPKLIETRPEEVPDSQEDNDDLLSRTDVYDDIFANETFRSTLEQSAAEIEAVEVDETFLVGSQKNIDADQFKKPENPELKIVSCNNDEMSDDDDIILSTQDTEAIDQKYREHQEEMNSTMDKMDEKIVDEVSDSDATDVEDEGLLLANVAQTSMVSEAPKMADVVNEVVIQNDANDDDSDEEEIDLLASTASKSDSYTEESIRNDVSLIKEAELAPTQLLTTRTAAAAAKEVGNSSDDETDDELPATQLLHLKSTSVPKHQKDDLFLVPTQLLVPESAEKNTSTNVNERTDNVSMNNKKDDDIFSAATQMLPPEVAETTNKAEQKISDGSGDIYSAATQILAPEDVGTNKKTCEGDSIYSAATQFLPPENDDDDDDEDDKFAAATQLLPPEIEMKVVSGAPEITKPPREITSENLVENGEEAIFSAATQILPLDKEILNKPETTEKEVIENEPDNIFSAPTQIILNPENEIPPQEQDDIFMAPTQILLDEDESLKKSGDSIRLSSESNEESMRLHLSETEPSSSTFNQEQEKVLQQEQQQQQQQQQNTETQLEVSFELDTQKLYIEEKTRRPDNPLSHLFAEEATQMTEQYDIGDNEDSDKNEEVNISAESTRKLTPIVSVVDIKKSKITLKDIQEASTSKIKKSYVKLERIKTEPTRRSNRNAKVAENETSPVDSEASEEAVESVKTTRSRTKVASDEAPASKVSEKQDKPTNEDKTTRRRTRVTENQDKLISEDVTREEKTSRRRTRTASSIESDIEVSKKIVKTSIPIKEDEEEVTKKIEDKVNKKPTSTSKTKLSEKIEERSENSEETDFKTNSNRHNTRGKRRDYKSIAKGELEDENESKSAKGRITSKSFMREKIEELEIHVKEERQKRSAAKTIDETDSDDSVFRSKRSKRNGSKEKNKDKEDREKEGKSIVVEDSDGSSIEINVRKKTPRIEDSQESRPKRNRKPPRRETEESKETNVGRSRRGLKNSSKQTSKANDDNEKLAIEIEDSDESILETKMQTRKRNSQMSPERNKPIASDLCLNTPNSKRRKYEPLSVNISSSQLNNDASAEHKVVFTMLNDANLETVVRKLGGSVIDSIHSCTVLVTNKISRSLKFLIAVALGKPIVHLKWILDSEKRKKFLDPWDYLLEDTESEVKFQMSLKQSLTTSKSKKLLSGETILLAATKNFSVLKEIIETSGGKCITRAPPKNTKAVVVCYEDERSKYSKYLKQKTLTVVSAEAIFSGVLQQKLNWKQYVLS